MEGLFSLPYTGPDDKSLPSNVLKLAKKQRAQWVEVWNSAYERCDDDDPKACEAAAFRQANGTIKKAKESNGLQEGSPSDRLFCDEFVPLTEAARDGVLPVTIIQPGFNTSKTRYYQAAALERDHGVFDGLKMYLDHPTKADERARPEGSIREWVANLTNPHIGPSGEVQGDAVIIDPAWQGKVDLLAERDQLHTVGLSIRAVGDVKNAVIEGVKTLSVEGLPAARSVDFVTEPGAGGRVITEAEQSVYDLDLVNAERVKERRPDIVETLRRELIQESGTPPKEDDSMTDPKALEEAQRVAKEAEDKAAQAQQQLAERDKRLAELEAGEKRRAVQETVAKIVTEAKVPEPIAERVQARFADATEADEEAVRKAIQEEQDYAKRIAGAGKVRGLGESQPGTASEAGTKRLEEAFQKLGLNEDGAKVAASAGSR